MEELLICLDTSVLIEYYQKTKKENAFLLKLTGKYHSFAVSVITEYEIYVGSNPEQDVFWNEFFNRITILPLDSKVNKATVHLYRSLKKERKLIDIPDLLIGATALAHDLPLATLNEKHFNRIPTLNLETKPTL